MLAPTAGAIAREVRHELLSDLPYYSVFDWIEFEVLPDNGGASRPGNRTTGY